MKKLTTFQPSLINSLFPIPANQINLGQCFIWAYSAFLVFKDVELWDTDVHAFVKYKNKFYDSETLNGGNWDKLPACNATGILSIVPKYIYHYDHYNPKSYSCIKTFKNRWQLNLPRFNTSWDKIEKQSSMIIKKNTYERSQKIAGLGSSVCQAR